MKLGAAAVAAATGSSVLAGTVSGAVTYHGIGFQNVYDAVEDLGMDPTGNDPVDDAFAGAVGDDTLIEFPEGTYLWEEEHNNKNLQNFGVRGAGSDKVQFVVPENANLELLQVRDSSNILYEGFEVVQTDDLGTGVGLVLRADDGLEIHDIHFSGFSPSNDLGGPSNQLVPYVENVDGVGHVTNVRMTGGGVHDEYPNMMMGILMGTAHKGEIIFRNLDIRELGSSGFRKTAAPGSVKLYDSYFENVNNGCVRVGGGDHPSKRTVVKNCHFVADDALLQHLPSGEHYKQTDLIRIDSSGNDYEDVLVEDCVFEYRSHPDDAWSRGCIARPGFGDHGSFTVRGCTFAVDADHVEAIDASHASDKANDKSVVVENTHITGAQQDNKKLGSLVYIADSDDSVVRNCCINVTDGDLNGVHVDNCDNTSIEDSDILVGGKATVIENSDASTSGITNDGACRLPSDVNTDDGTTDDGTTDDGSTDDGSTDDGTTDDGSSTDPGSLPHSVELRGKGNATNYQFTVSGDLTGDGDLESWDTVSGSTADGWVTETTQVDTLKFSGSISSFQFAKGDATVLLNGTEVDPTTLGRTFEVVNPTDAAVDYSFVVDGTVAASSVTDGNVTYGGTATVEATADPGSSDVWTVAGPFDTFESSDTVDLSLDGESVSVTDVGGSTDGGSTDDGTTDDGTTDDSTGGGTNDSRTLRVTGKGDSTNYRFTVSGEITGSSDIESWDTVSTSSADGWVTKTTQSDVFEFTGEVIAFEFVQGDATVELDGAVVDPSTLGYEHRIDVVAYDDSTTATYEVTVSDSIVPNPDDGDQSVTDLSASTSVEDTLTTGTHSYRYEGAVTSFQHKGDAEVYIDGEQVDPDSLADGEVSHYDNKIVIDGSNTASGTNYEFAVTGIVDRSPDLASAETDDTIVDGVVSGSVSDRADAFRFTGTLVSMNVDGSASLSFGVTDQN